MNCNSPIDANRTAAPWLPEAPRRLSPVTAHEALGDQKLYKVKRGRFDFYLEIASVPIC